MNIFRAYDIRGIYGESLTEEIAENIGKAFVTFLSGKKIVVGRDARTHSPTIQQALVKGILSQGADVIDIGLCSTPVNYFANGTLKADGSIMITASHNPKQWNGFKLCRKDAVPISGKTGIKDIAAIAQQGNFRSQSAGTYTTNLTICDEYYSYIKKICPLTKKLKVVIDFANGMGSLEFAGLKECFEAISLYEKPDGNFPNHEANPLDSRTLDVLRKTVREEKADMGIAFDGDADRCGFIDENGEIVPLDLATGLIAQQILSRGPATVLYDLRSSWAVRECIQENGGEAIQCRVGHAFIKQQMRECGAAFAGELAGHYYFKENFVAESSALAIFLIARLIEEQGKPLSQLVEPLRRYYSTGEMNFSVENADAIIERIKTQYKGGRQYHLDGLSTEYESWWFNIRKSNTEPLLRIIIEAKTKATMAEKKKELISLIGSSYI